MQTLTVTGNIIAKPDQIELVKTALKKLISSTLAEDGCIQYDLHQDNDDPTYFMFFENWKSQREWEIHMNAPQLVQFNAETEGAIEKFWVHKPAQIS